MHKFFFLFTTLAFFLAIPALATNHCNRAETTVCGLGALYESKVFRESMREALGANFDPAKPAKKVRLYDGGWAAYKVGRAEKDHARQNRLPESYFKKTQWYMIEVADENLVKSFQVDLVFADYPENATGADYKTAAVETARVTELAGYKVEEEYQRAAAKKLPENGFVCESPDSAFVLRAEPMNDQPSFGQAIDAVLESHKSDQNEDPFGSYKVTVSEFGLKKPPSLPPVKEEFNLNMMVQSSFRKGSPDQYQIIFAGTAPNLIFRRRLDGYNNSQKFCSKASKGSDSDRAEICDREPGDEIEIQVRDKKWEKSRCIFFEKVSVPSA